MSKNNYHVQGLGLLSKIHVKSHVSHYSDVIMDAMGSEITSVPFVYSTVCSCADQSKRRSYALLALCEGNSTVTVKFPSQRASNAENVSIWWRHHGQQWFSKMASDWLAALPPAIRCQVWKSVLTNMDLNQTTTKYNKARISCTSL